MEFKLICLIFFKTFVFDLVLNFTAGLCNRLWLLWHLSFLSVTQRIGPPTVSALPVTSRNSSIVKFVLKIRLPSVVFMSWSNKQFSCKHSYSVFLLCHDCYDTDFFIIKNSFICLKAFVPKW